MSGQAIERELADYLAHSEYEVRFHMTSDDWFYVRVYYCGDRIAEKAVVRSHPRGARWARRKIKSHAKARGILGGLVKPAKPARDRTPA